MSVTIKICGITTPEALDAAVKGGARYVGFVFFAKSPRNLGFDQARALAMRMPAHVGTVGLFVDPAPGFVAEAVRVVGLDVIQLHGEETPAFVHQLGTAHGTEIWKAIPVRTRTDLEAGRAYQGAAARLLYDAKPPVGAAMPGGNGLRFDWTLLEGFAHPLPWALSGGLDAGNVSTAIGISGARMVDVSSGVESAPGIKDVDKIAAFLQAVAAL